MKKILGALAVVAMITLIAPAPAQAQATGDVQVSIDLTGGILILYYYSNLEVNIDLADLVGTPAGCVASGGELRCETAGLQEVNATATPSSAIADFALTPAALGGTLTALPLAMENVWAVRAIGGTTNQTELEIAGTAGPLVNGASEIDVANWEVTDGTSTAGTITFTDPGLVTAVVGDVLVDLDFTGTTAGGLHTTAGVEYTLTATNL